MTREEVVALVLQAHLPLESTSGDPGEAGCMCRSKLEEYTYAGWTRHVAKLIVDGLEGR